MAAAFWGIHNILQNLSLYFIAFCHELTNATSLAFLSLVKYWPYCRYILVMTYGLTVWIQMTDLSLSLENILLSFLLHYNPKHKKLSLLIWASVFCRQNQIHPSIFSMFLVSTLLLLCLPQGLSRDMVGLKDSHRSLVKESPHLCLSSDALPNCHGGCRLESSPAVSRQPLPAEQRTRERYMICNLHTWESWSTEALQISSRGECNSFIIRVWSILLLDSHFMSDVL